MDDAPEVFDWATFLDENAHEDGGTLAIWCARLHMLAVGEECSIEWATFRRVE